MPDYLGENNAIPDQPFGANAMPSDSHPADRNLLFGIVALQMDFISREQLVAAMAAWVVDKHKSLGEVLCEQAALSPEDHEAIESLVRRHLLRHDNAAERSLAALSSIGRRLRDDLSHIANSGIQASLPVVGSARGDTESTLSYVGSPTTPGGRFRILRPHAQGGLGVVSVALDEELHREVALKEMQERYASDEQPRLRFLLEAEITGGLEHPGIVPVYGLGHHPDGRPFYAMRFVRGESLKEAVARFHGDPGHVSARSPSNTRGTNATPLAESGEPGRVSAGSPSTSRPSPSSRSNARGADATPLPLRRLLSRFLDVCNAIAYAHSRGVLHRDIKPGNILLGPYGETLVVDWGLAKIVGRDEPGTGDASAEPMLRPPSASGTGETVPGTAMGTPAYMSPEQAEGKLDLLGPSSDVYSLGATLYVVLTGRAPFDGINAAEVLPKVQRGEFTRPRVVNVSIPKPLEAICVKAMALKPADRYATPHALAEDIEHWLADEPVSAYREPWPDRVQRWARKHRTLVTSGAAVLLLGLLCSAGFATVVTAKNRELGKQTERAHVREQMAIDAVKRFRDVVVEEPVLKNNPALQELRKRLLNEPLAFFKSLRALFQGDRDTRPEALSQLAVAAFELAKLAYEIGDRQDALGSFRDSMAIRERLARENPNVTQFLSDLAKSQGNIGVIERETGRPEQALESYRKTLAILERLARENLSVTEFQSDLAIGHNNIGKLQWETGHSDQALESFAKGLAIRERLARENPSVTQFQSDLAKCHHNVGLLQSETGHSDQALESYRKTLAILERLVLENPSVTEFQRDLAASHGNIGNLQWHSGYSDQALESFAKALANCERLARENPSVTQFQSHLASSHSNIGVLQESTGQTDQASESYSKALAIRERLVLENPSVTEFQNALAASHNNIGTLQWETGQSDRALQSLAKALAIFERLARNYPKSPDYASNLGTSLNAMAKIDLGAKRFQQARDRLQRAISWQNKALAANPRHPTYRQFLRNHLTNLIEAANGLGNDNEARAAQRELDELAPNDPATAAVDQRLAAVVRGEAPKDNPERLQLAYRAYEKKLYAASMRLCGQALEADAKLADDPSKSHRYNAACAAARAAASGTGTPDRKETSGRTEKPLTDADRANFRNQARAWLEAELKTWSGLLQSAKSHKQRQAIAGALEHWRADTDLASVRDTHALDSLPEGERAMWKTLWAEMDRLLKKAVTP
jgi:serine/threonine-protein kinase